MSRKTSTGSSKPWPRKTSLGARPSPPGTGRFRRASRASKKENSRFSIAKRPATCRACLREQALGQYDRYAKFPPERLNNAREGYRKTRRSDRAVMFRAGGIIRAGSDPNNGLPGLGVHQEMVMFVEAGLTPMQAIQAATINVAKAFPQGQRLRHRRSRQSRRLHRRGRRSAERHVGDAKRQTGRARRQDRRSRLPRELQESDPSDPSVARNAAGHRDLAAFSRSGFGQLRR